MFDITGPRKVVIDHCRRRGVPRSKMTPGGFAFQLRDIRKAVDDNGGILTPDQAWFIAEGSWSLIARIVGPDMAPAFSCLPMPDALDNLSDHDRVTLLALGMLDLLVTEVNKEEPQAITYARILSMGIRIATDALLASSPEIFQEG